MPGAGTVNWLVSVLATTGEKAWRLVTSVRFAIAQILLLVVALVIGAIVRQIPAADLRDPARYAMQLADLHARYDGLQLFGVQVGPSVVGLFADLGLFRVFSAPWFVLLLTLLTVSIVCCTVNRLPTLWGEIRRTRVAQPVEFFDPILSGRARIRRAGLGVDEAVAVLRRRHYRVKIDAAAGIAEPDAVAIYGDRNQYMKLGTLITHLGLVLFLVGALATVTLGFETVVFVGNGQTAPVQPVGTPGNLLLRNVQFRAPQLPDGRFADFTTDLEVYKDGALIARKTIRVNDPLQVEGFTIHQNTFGPAADLTLRTPSGDLLWKGPVVLAGVFLGRPQGVLAVPGSEVSLLLLLDSAADGSSRLVVEGFNAANPALAAFVIPLLPGQASNPTETAGYQLTFDGTDAWTGLVVKRDPGADIVWLAFVLLGVGLAVTFYFPRRRAWMLLTSDEVLVAIMADRYVDSSRESDDIVKALAPDS